MRGLARVRHRQEDVARRRAHPQHVHHRRGARLGHAAPAEVGWLCEFQPTFCCENFACGCEKCHLPRFNWRKLLWVCLHTTHPWTHSGATRRTAPGTWRRASRPRSSTPAQTLPSWRAVRWPRGRRGRGALGGRARRQCDRPFRGSAYVQGRGEIFGQCYQVGEGFVLSRALIAFTSWFRIGGVSSSSRSPGVHRPPPHRRRRVRHSPGSFSAIFHLIF